MPVELVLTQQPRGDRTGHSAICGRAYFWPVWPANSRPPGDWTTWLLMATRFGQDPAALNGCQLATGPEPVTPIAGGETMTEAIAVMVMA